LIALTKQEQFEEELTILANGLKQIYKFYYDYKSNKYPVLKYNSNKQIFPIITTLENWYIIGNGYFHQIEEKTKGKLEKIGIDPKIVDQYPFQICSISEFEFLLQVFQYENPENVIKNKLDKYKNWAFNEFLIKEHQNKSNKYEDFIFEEEFKDLFKKYLNNS